MPAITPADPYEIPRLGESFEFGATLLNLLSAWGWSVVVRSAVGGGLIVEVARGNLSFRRTCDSIADVAAELFTTALRRQRAEALVSDALQKGDA